MLTFLWCLLLFLLAPFCGVTMIAFVGYQACHGFWAFLMLVPLGLAVLYDKRNWQENKKLAVTAVDAFFDFIFHSTLPEYKDDEKEEKKEEDEDDEEEVDVLGLAERWKNEVNTIVGNPIARMAPEERDAWAKAIDQEEMGPGGDRTSGNFDPGSDGRPENDDVSPMFEGLFGNNDPPFHPPAPPPKIMEIMRRLSLHAKTPPPLPLDEDDGRDLPAVDQEVLARKMGEGGNDSCTPCDRPRKFE
ncbi:MAG: hypothetical protein NTY66_03180 [Candidatus Vogelbacteria bacterium]|nr:hypothetical protein [Candidatus Vogelbacteria bacterium]